MKPIHSLAILLLSLYTGCATTAVTRSGVSADFPASWSNAFAIRQYDEGKDLFVGRNDMMIMLGVRRSSNPWAEFVAQEKNNLYNNFSNIRDLAEEKITQLSNLTGEGLRWTFQTDAGANDMHSSEYIVFRSEQGSHLENYFISGILLRPDAKLIAEYDRIVRSIRIVPK